MSPCAMAARVCVHCGGEIDPYRPPGTRYCADSCSRRARTGLSGPQPIRGPVVFHPERTGRSCVLCGSPIHPDAKADQVFCSNKCSRRLRVPPAGGDNTATGESVLSLFLASGGRCAYCPSTSGTTVDHITPISRGGTSEIGNLTTACQSCNSSKGAKDVFVWYFSGPVSH